MIQRVFVIGGGPAGSGAAIELAQRDIDVLLFEQIARAGNKLSETLYPEAEALLQKMGVGPVDRRPLSVSYLGLDGNTRLNVSFSGKIGVVDRNTLDYNLRGAATAVGVKLIDAHVDHVEKSSDGIVVHAQGVAYQGSYLIDASGKNPITLNEREQSMSAALLDKRFNVFSHFENDRGFDIESPVIVALDKGFAYVLPIRRDRICIGVTSYRSFGNADFEEIYASLLRQSDFVSALMEDARRVLPIIPAKNIASTNEANPDPRITRIGDALGFRDPFLWDGLSFALETGRAAGNLCATTLNNGSPDLNGYSRFANGLEAKIRQAVLNHYEEVFTQFNPAMGVDPHVSPFITGCLFCLTGGTARGLSDLRAELNAWSETK